MDHVAGTGVGCGRASRVGCVGDASALLADPGEALLSLFQDEITVVEFANLAAGEGVESFVQIREAVISAETQVAIKNG